MPTLFNESELVEEFENYSQLLSVLKSSPEHDQKAINSILQNRSTVFRKLGLPAQAIYDLSQIVLNPETPSVQTLYNLTYALIEAECFLLAEANRVLCIEHAKAWGMEQVVEEMEQLKQTIQTATPPIPGLDLVRCPHTALPWDHAAFSDHLYSDKSVEEAHNMIFSATNGFLGIKLSPGKGRGVVAMKDISSGTILHDRPLVSSSWKKNSICCNCTASLNKKKKIKCRNCKEFFCTERCKKEAMDTWHVVLCGKRPQDQEWMSASLQYSDTTSDLALTNIIKIFAEAKHKGISPIEIPWVKQLTVASDESDLFIPTNTWAFYTATLELIDAIGDPLFEFWHYTAIQQRLHNNSFGSGSMSTGATDSVWKWSSFLNHSCNEYNASTTGLKLQFTQNVRKGDEVLISYSDASEVGEDRNNRLTKYGIKCECSLCKPK